MKSIYKVNFATDKTTSSKFETRSISGCSVAPHPALQPSPHYASSLGNCSILPCTTPARDTSQSLLDDL